VQKFLKVFDWKTYIVTIVAIISFSNFMAVLFGQTIPGIFMTFFRYAGETIILIAVFLFALAWLLKAKPHNRPKKYSIVVFDVFGRKSEITDIRTEFKTHDVAWSFMKQYKKSYPLYNFAMISEFSKSSKPTIFRYI
jgi:predicted membrane channel-forming protein YqfA (hemolysin III family)